MTAQSQTIANRAKFVSFSDRSMSTRSGLRVLAENAVEVTGIAEIAMSEKKTVTSATPTGIVGTRAAATGIVTQIETRIVTAIATGIATQTATEIATEIATRIATGIGIGTAQVIVTVVMSGTRTVSVSAVMVGTTTGIAGTTEIAVTMTGIVVKLTEIVVTIAETVILTSTDGETGNVTKMSGARIVVVATEMLGATGAAIEDEIATTVQIIVTTGTDGIVSVTTVAIVPASEGTTIFSQTLPKALLRRASTQERRTETGVLSPVHLLQWRIPLPFLLPLLLHLDSSILT